ncbi:hypothetical protein [Micromonospora sp. NBC_01796]|uniref:hypothetical protein n=1 Tax=Micromonospora sp. NBC_01796 TaxID=2975987 RepID=UPI002DD84D2F|nr:hypothetical protein [Micromonospora sp. NBC_01796]WSA83248.1 hypothetical protein OIE47_22890 [Micromonospora sp. NBC_01796]
MTQNPNAGDGRAAKVQAAKQGAAQTGQQVSQAGGQLAHSAVDQSRDVANEASRQARQLMEQASNQLKQQANEQQHRAADGLRALADELQTMSERTEQQGVATDLVRHAADRAHQAAQWLDQREPGTVVSEVRDYARRNPGIFLAGAAVAGILAGRLGKSMRSMQSGGDMHEDGHRGDGHRQGGGSGTMSDYRPGESTAPGASFQSTARGNVDEEADPGVPAADSRPGGARL